MVAKIKKRKLQWTASQSPQVVAYKLYWAQGAEVSYDSPSAKLGKVTEVVLPDDVEGFVPDSGPVEFGVTAVDEMGNESDLVTITAPHQFNAPQAPGDIWIEGHQDAASKNTEENIPDAKKPEEKQPEAESHVSLLEHTIKGAEQQKAATEKESGKEAEGLNKLATHYGPH